MSSKEMPMLRTLKNMFTRLAVTASMGVAAALFVAAPLSAQEKAPKADDAVEDAKEAPKDAPKEPRPKAKPADDDPKDAPKEAPEDAKDPADEPKDSAKAPDKPAKGAREDAKEPVKGARETTREPAKGARETTREPAKGARETTRETSRETSRSIESFRAQDVRSADFGLWFSRSTTNGLVISDVSTRGAIAKLGFREGDRIISVNGQKVVRDVDFIQYLFAEDVRDQRVEVIVFRGGKQVVVYVEPIVLIREYYAVQVDPLEQFGVILDDRYADRIVIWRVVPRSPAYYAGIRAGDVLVTFSGQRVTSPDAFVQLVQKVEPGNVAVEVMRDKQSRKYEVEFPRVAARTDVERASERREGRIEERREEREERREEGAEKAVPPRAAPAVPAVPRPGALPRRP
jgi:C-terminal processing protease CtpA/Prc